MENVKKINWKKQENIKLGWKAVRHGRCLSTPILYFSAFQGIYFSYFPTLPQNNAGALQGTEQWGVISEQTSFLYLREFPTWRLRRQFIIVGVSERFSEFRKPLLKKTRIERM